MTFSAKVVSSLLTAALLLLSRPAAADHHGKAGPIYPVVEQISPDVRLVRLTPEVAVEQIRGASAISHLNKLIARNPEAFAKARQNWARRGYTPTQEVFIERTVRNSQGIIDPSDELHRTQSSGESNAEGEILFWSYDGPGYTWQGTIYVEVYADNTASVWEGQIDTSTEDHPWNFQEMTWSGSGGGYNGPDDQEMRKPAPPPLPGHALRSIGVHLAVNREAAFGSGNGILPVGFHNWAVCWRSWVVGGCTTAAIGCIRVKVAWPACFATWCIGAEVGGAIACAL